MCGTSCICTGNVDFIEGVKHAQHKHLISVNKSCVRVIHQRIAESSSSDSKDYQEEPQEQFQILQ